MKTDSPERLVVDIGLASDVVKEVLSGLNFSNLDDHPDFKGKRSTTEAVARWIFEKIQAAARAGRRLAVGSRGCN